MPPKSKLDIHVDDRTAQMTIGMLKCRAERRHILPDIEESLAGFRPSRDGIGLQVEAECLRCLLPVTEMYNILTGERITDRVWDYRAQPDYLLPKEDGHSGERQYLSADAARQALFARLLK